MDTVVHLKSFCLVLFLLCLFSPFFTLTSKCSTGAFLQQQQQPQFCDKVEAQNERKPSLTQTNCSLWGRDKLSHTCILLLSKIQLLPFSFAIFLSPLFQGPPGRAGFPVTALTLTCVLCACETAQLRRTKLAASFSIGDIQQWVCRESKYNFQFPKLTTHTVWVRWGPISQGLQQIASERLLLSCLGKMLPHDVLLSSFQEKLLPHSEHNECQQTHSRSFSILFYAMSCLFVARMDCMLRVFELFTLHDFAFAPMLSERLIRSGSTQCFVSCQARLGWLTVSSVC